MLPLKGQSASKGGSRNKAPSPSQFWRGPPAPSTEALKGPLRSPAGEPNRPPPLTASAQKSRGSKPENRVKREGWRERPRPPAEAGSPGASYSHTSSVSTRPNNFFANVTAESWSSVSFFGRAFEFLRGTTSRSFVFEPSQFFGIGDPDRPCKARTSRLVVKAEE